jgi:hypothetical protein
VEAETPHGTTDTKKATSSNQLTSSVAGKLLGPRTSIDLSGAGGGRGSIDQSGAGFRRGSMDIASGPRRGSLDLSAGGPGGRRRLSADTGGQQGAVDLPQGLHQIDEEGEGNHEGGSQGVTVKRSAKKMVAPSYKFTVIFVVSVEQTHGGLCQSIGYG